MGIEANERTTANIPWRLVCAFAATIIAFGAGAVEPAPTTESAVWMPHDIIVDLQDLPQHYSCDQLWYKFRAVLLQIGARPDIKILPYRCAKASGANARSPRVHLQFATAEMVQSTQVQSSDIPALPRTVTLAAGQPPAIDGSDCELLRQIKDTLFSSLSDRVINDHLACNGPPAQSGHFSLSVEAVMPEPRHWRARPQIPLRKLEESR